MPDLEQRIVTWLQVLADEGLGREQLLELEDHLRTGVARQLDAGLTPAQAFARSAAALGAPRALAHEFHKERVMHPLSKLFGVTFTLCAIYVAGWFEGAHVAALLSEFALTPMIMMIGVVLGGLTASHGLRDVMRTLSVAIAGRRPHPGEVERLQMICRRGQKLAYTACMLQLVFSTMHILSVLDSPHLIGPAIAHSLIAVVYAALLAELGFGSAERWVAPQPA